MGPFSFRTISAILVLMAIRNIPVPFCDECGEPWLPKFKLPDGTHNPIFDHPEDSKRCGKCKTTRWNAAGVDKRRKTVEEPSVEEYAAATSVQLSSIALGKDPVAAEAAELVASACGIPIVTRQDVLQTIDRPAPSTGRCKHMLYNCPQCHPKEAA